jgi:hypothetical protein
MPFVLQTGKAAFGCDFAQLTSFVILNLSLPTIKFHFFVRSRAGSVI